MLPGTSGAVGAARRSGEQMSDGAEQGGADAVRTGEVRVPADAGAVLPGGDGDEADETDDAASLGAAEWPAGEADEPQGEAQVREGEASGSGGAVDDGVARAGRETDDGELTPSDPSLDPGLDPGLDQGMPPANLAEPLR